MTLGERICQYRTERRLSQQEVAEKLEVSRQSVSKWETDGAVPELDKLVKLCELFEVSLDELVRGEEPQESEAPEMSKKGQDTVLTVQMTQSRPERSTAQVAVGAVLLAVALLACLGMMFTPGGLHAANMIIFLPLLVCGIVCLTVRENAGAVCVGIILLMLFAGLFVMPVLSAFFEHF